MDTCETGIETQSHVDTQFVRQALRHTVARGHTVCDTGIETHSHMWTHSL